MHISKSSLLGLALAGTLVIAQPGCAPTKSSPAQDAIRPQELQLRLAMRKLWEDHVSWTRMVIVSTATNAKDLDATTQRLLQNQVDLGNAIKPYYGDPAGTKLSDLLRTHILGAAAILAAAKANDTAKLDTAKASWYANGDEIATFLSQANPTSWPEAEMKAMMKDHLDITLTEAVDYLQGRHAESVADYDKAHDQILRMADMLSDGIAKQFPNKV